MIALVSLLALAACSSTKGGGTGAGPGGGGSANPSASGTNSSGGTQSASATPTTPAVPKPTFSAAPLPKVIKIGVEGPLTGSQVPTGSGMVQGAELAAAQINAGGGLLGHKIQIVPIDDAADPNTAIRASQHAISQHLSAVIGPFTGGAGTQVMWRYLKAKLTPIRLTTTSSQDGMGYSLQPNETTLAPKTVKALQYLHAKRVALIYDDTDTATMTMDAALIASLKSAGIKLTYNGPLLPGNTNYLTQVNAAAGSHPDAIMSIAYYPEAANIAASLLEEHLSATCVIDYVGADPNFIPLSGVNAAKRCHFIGAPTPTSWKGGADFASAYKGKYLSPPGTWSPYTYDAVNLLADALKTTGSLTPSALKAYFGWEQNFVGVTGPITFDTRTGNRVSTPVVMLQVDGSGQLQIDSAGTAAL